MERPETASLPEDPALAATAIALRDAGHWAEIVDRQWRWVYVTDDFRLSYGGLRSRIEFPVGAHYFGEEAVAARLQWLEGVNTVEHIRDNFEQIGGWTLTDTPGGAEELRGLVAPALRDIVARLGPASGDAARTVAWHGTQLGRKGLAFMTAMRVRDANGRLAGTALICNPRRAWPCSGWWS